MFLCLSKHILINDQKCSRNSITTRSGRKIITCCLWYRQKWCYYNRYHHNHQSDPSVVRCFSFTISYSFINNLLANFLVLLLTNAMFAATEGSTPLYDSLHCARSCATPVHRRSSTSPRLTDLNHLRPSGNYMNHLLWQSVMLHFVFIGFAWFSL
jgi:hypothetical protein